MSFGKALTLGSHHLAGGMIRQLVLMEGRLIVESEVGSFVLEGERLEHCFIDCVRGLLPGSILTSAVPGYPLAWQVRAIHTAGKLPQPVRAIEPFEGRLAEGLLLYETPKAWHLFPLKRLRAMGYRQGLLYVVIDDKAVELTTTQEAAKAEFDALAASSFPSRHSTMRTPGEWLGLLSVDRFHVDNIRIRPFDADKGLHGLRLTAWHCFDPALGSAPRRSRSGPDR